MSKNIEGIMCKCKLVTIKWSVKSQKAKFLTNLTTPPVSKFQNIKNCFGGNGFGKPYYDISAHKHYTCSNNIY